MASSRSELEPGTTQWKHVCPITNDEGEMVAARLTIYPGDIEEYFTFVTPEAYFALDEWMKFRTRYGEEITVNLG